MAIKRVKNRMSISICCIILLTITYLYMTSDSYRLKMGNKHYDKGNYKSAVKYFSKIKEVDIETLLKKSKGEIKLNNFSDALKTLDMIDEMAKSKNENLDLVKLFYDKVICLNTLGKYDDIIRLSDDYLKIPKGSELNKNIESHIIYAFELFRKNKENVEFINKMIKEYEGKGDKDYLIKLYKSLSKLYPIVVNEEIGEHIEEINRSGSRAYPFVKDVADKAFEAYDKLISYEPDNSEHYIVKATIYEQVFGPNKAYEYLLSLKEKLGKDSEYLKFLKGYEAFTKLVYH